MRFSLYLSSLALISTLVACAAGSSEDGLNSLDTASSGGSAGAAGSGGAGGSGEVLPFPVPGGSQGGTLQAAGSGQGGDAQGGQEQGGQEQGGQEQGGQEQGGQQSNPFGGGGKGNTQPAVNICKGQSGWSCDPVSTSAQCDGGGSACDLTDGGFECFQAPNDAQVGDFCDINDGPFCAQGGTCLDGVCVRFCCSDDDCGGGTCSLADLGVPVVVGVCDGGTGAGGSTGGGGSTGEGGGAGCEVSFSEISDILVTSCTGSGCHSTKNPKISSNPGTLYTQLTGQFGCGKGVVPGSPGSSILYKVITSGACGELMPPGNALPSSDIDKISAWISCGAPNN